MSVPLKVSERGRGWEGLLGSLRRRPLLAAAVMVGCVLAVGVSAYLVGVQLWAEHHWRSAQAAAQDCYWDRAKEHLEACLRVRPDSAEAHFELARCYRRGGDLEDAQKHLRRARELGWLTEAVDLETLLLMAQGGGVVSVEKTLQSHLKSGHREGPIILEALVQGYLQSNALQEAYQYASRWVLHYPDDWQAYWQRAMVLRRFAVTLTPLRQATLDYEKAAELNPSHAGVRLGLAQILEFSGRYEEALPHFEFVCDAQPSNADAVGGMVRCLFSQSQLQRASKLLDAYFQNHQGNGDLFYLRGRLSLDMDAPEEAAQWLLKALPELGRGNPEFLHVLAQALRRGGRNFEADQHEAHADHIEADLRRVREIIKEIADSRNDQPSIVLRLEAAELLARRGQEEEAARWLINALQIDPAHLQTRKTLEHLARRTRNEKLVSLHRRLSGGDLRLR